MNGTINATVCTIIDRVYPVGIIIDFAVEADPNTAIGCGTVWTRIADGRALIASDASHPVGWTGGELVHTLTVEEMPYHAHAISRQPLLFTEWTDGGACFAQKESTAAYVTGTTEGTGGSQPHNNLPPSLSVCRWKRVA